MFGLGAVGLSVVQGAVFNKAGRIIGIDVNPSKENIARELGITDFVNPNDYDKPIQQVWASFCFLDDTYAFDSNYLSRFFNSAGSHRLD